MSGVLAAVACPGAKRLSTALPPIAPPPTLFQPSETTPSGPIATSGPVARPGSDPPDSLMSSAPVASNGAPTSVPLAFRRVPWMSPVPVSPPVGTIHAIAAPAEEAVMPNAEASASAAETVVGPASGALPGAQRQTSIALSEFSQAIQVVPSGAAATAGAPTANIPLLAVPVVAEPIVVAPAWPPSGATRSASTRATPLSSFSVHTTVALPAASSATSADRFDASSAVSESSTVSRVLAPLASSSVRWRRRSPASGSASSNHATAVRFDADVASTGAPPVPSSSGAPSVPSGAARCTVTRLALVGAYQAAVDAPLGESTKSFVNAIDGASKLEPAVQPAACAALGAAPSSASEASEATMRVPPGVRRRRFSDGPRT